MVSVRLMLLGLLALADLIAQAAGDVGDAVTVRCLLGGPRDSKLKVHVYRGPRAGLLTHLRVGLVLLVIAREIRLQRRQPLCARRLCPPVGRHGGVWTVCYFPRSAP
jgi:hypothetical protein